MREPIPAVSHLLKFDFSSEKRENSLKMFIRYLTEIKPPRKNVESSANSVYEIAWLNIVICLMSALFFY